MTTTPVKPPETAIPPHCTITGCWSSDIHELHDKAGRVIAHYCPDHRVAVATIRQNVKPASLCKVIAWEVIL